MKTEPLFLVSDQLDLGIRGPGRGQAVLRPIKDQDPSIYRKSSDDVGILWLVSSLVDLSRVVNLLRDVEANGRRLARGGLASVAADLASILVVVVGVGSNCLGDLDLGNLEVVWLALCSVSSNQQPMDEVVLVLGVLHVWEPLSSQCRPF